jgi:hypothetical protein
MNRVVMNMDAQGIFTIYSDEPIEFYTVSDHTPADRVYQMRAEVGVEKVREQLGADFVGHMGDEFLETRSNYGKKPPAKRKLEVVKP